MIRIRTTTTSSWFAVIALSGLVLTAGCYVGYARPGFVGVPEMVNRSNDCPLPLSTANREKLVSFMAFDGNRVMLEEEEEVSANDRQRIERVFGAILNRLTENCPITTADLREDTGFSQQFDKDLGILTVHDARVDRDEEGGYYDLDTTRVLALVKDRFVFAFYLRRLQSAKLSPDAPLSQAGWTLTGKVADEAGSGPFHYNAVVVFPRAFAIPERAR